MVFGFIYTDLSFFLARVQGLPYFWVGNTLWTMALSLFLTSFPLGILADKYGRRKMLIIGNVAASLSIIGFALTSNLLLVLIVAVIEGTGEAAFAVSGNALLADKAGDNKRTPAFSLIQVLGWIAGAIGSLAIFSVEPLQGVGLTVAEAHTILYLVVGLIGLSITPLILKVSETPRYFDNNQVRRGILPRKSARILLRFSAYSVMIAVGAGLFVPLMTLWFSAAYGVTDAISGPVLAVSGILTAVAVFLSPRLARKFGIIRAIVLTQGLSTLFMAVVPSSPTFGIAASVYTVRVFLMNLSNPLSQSLIMGLVSPDERGMASGVSASLWRLPNALSSIVGAIWIGAGLLALPFYVATVLYVTAIVSFWFLFKNSRLPEETEMTGETTKELTPIQQESAAIL